MRKTITMRGIISRRRDDQLAALLDRVGARMRASENVDWAYWDRLYRLRTRISVHRSGRFRSGGYDAYFSISVPDIG